MNDEKMIQHKWHEMTQNATNSSIINSEEKWRNFNKRSIVLKQYIRSINANGALPYRGTNVCEHEYGKIIFINYVKCFT